MRWGTNHVEAFPFARIYGTETFETFFDPGGSTHEAQAAWGDSGGEVFARTDKHWNLAGILFAIALCGGQPGQTALYGNGSYAADLSVYRDQIRVVKPEPSGGLWLGGMLVAALGRRRQTQRALRSNRTIRDPAPRAPKGPAIRQRSKSRNPS